MVIGRGLYPLKGRGVISVTKSDNTINEVRSLQTIYSPVVIGRGLSSLTWRGVISVSISDNIINKVSCLQTIYSPVDIGRGLSSLTGRGVISVSLFGQYNQRRKKLTNNILTCGYWEGTLPLEGAGCYFCN